MNLRFGDSEPRRVVELVRRSQVDVVSLQELSPELSAALDRVDLAGLLPHRVFRAEPGAAGTGIASR